MSNALAIAATTATLRNLLLSQVPLIDNELADLEVTTQPPDLARKTVTKAQLNLFLYGTALNAAWRNRDPWPAVRPGEDAAPPLALDLHYMLTAYGRGENDNDALSHRALGCAMGLLNDHSLLGPDEIAAALAGNDLDRQVERVRITPLMLGVEEMSKLWTTFQTQYRVSCAWAVGVILIDSRRAVRAPLPVLRRGEGDTGPQAVAGLPPVLQSLRLPRSQSAVRLGEELAIRGENFVGAALTAVISSALQKTPIELAPRNEAGELRLTLPAPADDPTAFARWHPGFHQVAIVQSRPGAPPVSSNALPFALAPQIAVSPLNAALGDVALTVTCAPRLREGQRVLLIFGDRTIAPDAVTTPADTAQPSTLDFTVPEVAKAAAYVVRLRVDGADSIPVILAGDPPVPQFDPAQTVSVA